MTHPAQNKTWFRMEADPAAPAATIDIFDEIGMFGIGFKDFDRQLRALGKIDAIHLRINSPGGSVIDGFAIYDVLLNHPAQIVVEIQGWAASMASIIAMAGDIIRMPSNAWMMIHNPWTVALGGAEDLERMANVLRAMKKHAVAAYRRHAKNLTDEDIGAYMDAETWMSGEDAVGLGFADYLTDALAVAACVTPLSGMTAPEGALAWVRPQAAEPTTAPQGRGHPSEEGTTQKETDDAPPTAELPPPEIAVVPDSASGDGSPFLADGATDSGEPSGEAPAPEAGEPGASVAVEEATPLAVAISDLAARVDAAYEEGLDAGRAESTASLRAEMQARLDEATQDKARALTELSAAKAHAADLHARLDRLAGGFKVDSGADLTFEELVKDLGLPEAKKRHPAKYIDFMERKKNRS